MDNDPMIEALFHSGRFVTVEGTAAQENLKLLGHFGTNLESARRKDVARRGPADCQILESNPSLEPSTVLTLHEAFFLNHALKRVIVKSENSDTLDPNAIWHNFRAYYEKSLIRTDFAVEYAVYYYFRTRGWVVKSGDNYGTDFLLYIRGPSIDHAQYAVKIVTKDQSIQPPLGWDTLLTFHRVVQSVSKELLFVFVAVPEDLSTPDCISKMRLTIHSFAAQSSIFTKNAKPAPDSEAPEEEKAVDESMDGESREGEERERVGSWFPTYRCPKCDKVYNSKKKIRVHVMRHGLKKAQKTE